MIDWVERSSCILLSFGILVNALSVRRIVQSWNFPAVIFSLAWFFYTIVPLICFPNAHVYPVAVFYILCASIAVSLGSLSTWRSAFAANAQARYHQTEDFGSGFLLFAFFSGFVITVACLLINSVLQGISLDRLVTNLNESAGEYAGRRYTEDIAQNAFQQIGTVLAYFCSGLGGLVITAQQRRLIRWLVIIASLSPSVFVMLSQSAKGMLFLCAAIFFGGILVARVRRGSTSLITRKAIPSIALGAVVGAFLVTASFFARGVTVDGLIVSWASYTSGHLFAFSDWFGSLLGRPALQSYDDPDLTGGFYTFMSVFKILGDDRPVPLGIYTEYIAIPPYIETNIYTVFRGMIRDYGIVGSLLAITILSFLTHKAYKSILVAEAPSFSVTVILLAFAFIYQSYIASTFTWASLPVGLLLVGIALYVRRLAAHHVGNQTSHYKVVG